ncbi:S8 family peptidase [Flavobacterium tyrosinilyticum]|uniref:S8 family peptidase n=1 Tax=Flavobacterium tyrosinilyticum TaxID=1658740 RepID=UPI00202DFB70|nr:S8 family peptidase [Flavobacterium tyrosinilyticum]MCM0668082.1 S8 family peptidase [Flavobacterium tyrosinilyticum]
MPKKIQPLFYTLLFIFVILVSCKSTKTPNNLNQTLLESPNLTVKQTWQFKDFQKDSIPGISLEKWYLQNKKKPKNKNLIIAVIDTQIDLKHEDLQGIIWTNTKEIPNNGIDDDHNGYIDDINGWSFTGTKSGAYVVWNRYEYVRIVEKWEPLFKGKSESEIEAEDIYKFKEYQRALKTFKEKNEYYGNWHQSLQYRVAMFPLVKDTLKYFFPKEDYTYKQLDSMYKKYKINDKTYRQMRKDKDTDLGALIKYMMVGIESGEKKLEDIKDKEIQLDSVLNKNLNLNYNERLSIADNPEILEKGYGNNKISNTIEGIRPIQDHNTMVSGLLSANRYNNKGIKGMTEAKIMPINISPSGDEHDKDIAMAIRYAVDNGAKVINMSFGKEFSMHRDWVIDAFKYAEKHNVLLVHSSGNDAEDVDQNISFPNDLDYDEKTEISNNFINVGSITQKFGATLVSDFSNYGKQNVDLFAPGEDIYTTGSENRYKFESGTSFAAPMVSGTAALIWTYYPKLSVKQVKQIILDSGTPYNIEVILPGTTDKKVPFSELSKTGKVLNLYDAMQLAERINKQNK